MSSSYIKDFVTEWSNGVSYMEIIDRCEEFIDEANSGNDAFEMTVETESKYSGITETTFQTSSKADCDQLERACLEAKKRMEEDRLESVFYLDHTRTLRTLTREAFCEQFHIDIPFVRFHWQALPEPDGVIASYIDEEEAAEAYFFAVDNHEKLWCFDEETSSIFADDLQTE